MEVVKIKRCIENYVKRVDSNTYGDIIDETINLNILLTQKMDDQGVFTDAPFKPLLPYLTQRPTTLGDFNSFTYGRIPKAPLSFYINDPIRVEGTSDDGNLPNVSSYRVDPVTGNPIYVNNLDMTSNSDLIFTGVINQDNEKLHYVLGADKDDINNTGVHYITFFNEYVNKVNNEGKLERYLKTDFYSDVNSINENNVTLSALTKQEEYLGLVFKPEVDSEVFINRGVADIFERHALLCELKTTNDIDTNRGGFIRT
jgi:hypothetical protein